ncbi:Eco57I restriction-modification methylase domain-containing protein [Macrococcus capreoli]
MSEDIYTKGNDISETALLRKDKKLLSILLKDYTTGQNIKWATDSYKQYGEGFYEDREITPNLITGWYDGFIQPRANKAKKDQQFRTKAKAEVFTPSWIVKLQVESVLNEMKDLSFDDFINTTWLEITCGEAPYMVNRYDMDTGELISLSERNGFIDKKFQLLNQQVNTKDDWMKYAIKIFQSSYGYEYQGDSLLLARENLLLTFIDNYKNQFDEVPENKLMRVIAEIISRNVFQMDGLKFSIPHSTYNKLQVQLSLFDENMEVENLESIIPRITKWVNNRNKVIIGGKDMKFNVAIGNPPYQGVAKGGNENYAKPIYHEFIDSAYKISDISVLIHPARFLFNAGSTPKQWNEKMLKDEHLKVIYYNPNSKEIFSNTDIKGGIAITFRDKTKNFEAINQFIPWPIMVKIINKIKENNDEFIPLSEIVYAPESYKFSDELHNEFPNAINFMSKGHKYGVMTNIFETINFVFKEKDQIDDSKNYFLVHGRKKNGRKELYIPTNFVSDHANLNYFKLLLPKSNGTGDFGEKLSDSIIACPNEIHTQTYMSFGNFDSEIEVRNLSTYIKTKFLRSLLSTLKITQDNKKKVWANVPLLSFKHDSEIDWSKSISEIDQQLYKKYNLTEEEINFIEENVKEMD